jgi:3-hydroxyisobutyrate dehydrogenase/2-hydroxy-3-oxopropionate reductase
MVACQDEGAVSRIAVVGIGAMGSRIARRLVDAGHEVIAWNRTLERAEALVGVTCADSPGAAAREAEVVITMVADARALRDVSEGQAGVVSGAVPPTTLIQMATVGREDVLRLASLLPPGVGLLDAPVLGSVSEAETGSLRIFVGGPPELLEQRMDVLFDLGSPMFVGPLGAGTAAKLVANATLFGVVGLLGEALALARGLGVSTDVAFDVMGTTPLAAQAERRRPTIESGEYPPRFLLSLARKDADLIVESAAAVGADVRLARVMRDLFTEAEGAGWEGRDYCAVLAHILTSRAPAAGSGASQRSDEGFSGPRGR